MKVGQEVWVQCHVIEMTDRGHLVVRIEPEDTPSGVGAVLTVKEHASAARGGTEDAIHTWRGIESGPRDGTRIVFGSVDWATTWTGRWLTEREPGEPRERWSGPRWQRDGFCDLALQPTHWMPLPSPPGDEKQ